MVYLVLLFSVCIVVAHAVTYRDYAGYQVITPWLKSDAEVEATSKYFSQNNDLEILNSAGVLTGRNDQVLAAAEASSAFQAFLRNKHIDFDIAVRDVQVVLRQEREDSHKWHQHRTSARTTRADKGPDFEIFHDYGEILDILKYFEKKFPDRVRRETLGKSWEGRSLELIKVSTNHSSSDRPILFANANIHAREWATNAAMLYSIDKLLHGSYDVLYNVDFHFLPLANPDGYEFSRNGDPSKCSSADRMWRKNRSVQANNCFGVDGNRNFPFKFGGASTSSDPCSDIFKGPKPASEYEVQAVINHLSSTRNIQAYVAVHSYGQLILYPYGYAANLPHDELPPNFPELEKVGKEMKEAMEAVNNATFKSEVSSKLYPVGGASDDYAKHTGVRFAYTFELRPINRKIGFCLPENQIKAASEELFAGLLTLAQATLK